MTMNIWPTIGASAHLPVSDHAAQLRKEISSLLGYGESVDIREESGKDLVPLDIIKRLCTSVLDLLDKIENQPSLADLAKAIKEIDQTTKTILTDVRAGSNRSESLPAKASPVLETAISVSEEIAPSPEPAGTNMEETLQSLGFSTKAIASMMALPPQTMQKIIENKKRSIARLQSLQSSASGSLPNSGTVIVNAQALATRSPSALHGTGGSSKIVLQSQGPAQDQVHEKIYRSLNNARMEIRLVKISPTSDPKYDVDCQLFVVSLDEKPKYKALSYSWGNPNDTVPMMLDGQRFDVTRNLKKALLRLRTLGTDTPYWIDAICINQKDMNERMHQVGLMREIFERPAEVVVWLGEVQMLPGDEFWDDNVFHWTGDEGDIRTINSILSFAVALADTYPEKPDSRSANPLVLGFCLLRLLAGDVHLSDIPLWQNINLRSLCLSGFQSIVAQPWWDRIWVVQEVILPSAVTIVLGNFTAPLQLYADASSNLERHKVSCCSHIPLTGEKDKASMNKFRQKMLIITQSANLWRRKEKTSLLTLLRLYYSKNATDPRDKIYGLLGLVTDWGNHGSSSRIQPDYNITPSGLFQDVAIQSISGSASLDVLLFRTERMFHKSSEQMRKISGAINNPQQHTSTATRFKPDPVELKLPSWAPNWETINERGFENQTLERINRAFVFNACASCPASALDVLYTDSDILTRTRILTLSAIRVGTVTDNAFPFLVTGLTALSADKLPLPLNPDNSPLSTTPYVGGGTQFDATCRALCADSFFASSNAGGGSLTLGHDGNSMFRRATEDDLSSIQAWRKWLQVQERHGVRRLPDRKDFPSAEEHARVVAADNSIRSAVLQRSFFHTNNGYIGVGGGASAKGELFILLGSRTPHLLQPVGEITVEGRGLKKLYMLTGEAYVPGIMDGEIIKTVAGDEGVGMDADGLRKAGLDVQEILLI